MSKFPPKQESKGRILLTSFSISSGLFPRCGRVMGGGRRRRVRGRSESEQAGDVGAVAREREGEGRRHAGGGSGLRRGRPPRDGEVDRGVVEIVLVRQRRARGQKLAQWPCSRVTTSPPPAAAEAIRARGGGEIWRRRRQV
jgi:hypothetical protein